MQTEYDLAKRAQARNDFAVSVAVTTGSAYSSGQTLGGLLTIDTSASVTGPQEEPWLSSILQSLVVLDPDAQNAAMDLFFFNAKPVTTMADKTTFAPTLADLQNCIGVVQVVAGDYASGGTHGSVAATAKQTNIARVLKPGVAKATALYCVPVCRGTPTYVAGSLYFRFQSSQGL